MASAGVNAGKMAVPKASPLLSAVVYANISAVVLAVLYVLARWGFPLPVMSIVKSVGVAFFVMNTAYFVSCLLDKKMSPLVSLPLCIIGNLLLIFALGFVQSSIFGDVLCFVGITLFFWLVKKSFPFHLQGKNVGYAALMLVCAVWLGAKMWSAEYLSPLFFENIATNAAHPDELWHMSISHIFQTYGVVSTGIDGIPRLPYHVGSHIFFAQLSNLLHVSVLDVYNLSYPVFFLPLLVLSMVLCVLYLRRMFHLTPMSPLLVWTALLIGWIGIFPRVLQNALNIDTIFFFSESYTVGMTCLFLLLPPAIELFIHLRKRKFFFGISALFLSLLVIGYIKISFLYLSVIVVAYLIWRLRLWRQKVIPLLFLFFVGCAVWLYGITHLSDHDGGVMLSHFFVHGLRWPWALLWPFGGLGMTGIYLWHRWDTLKNHTAIDAEVLIVLVIVGLLPGNILNLPGGIDVYFSDVARWVSLVLVLSRYPEILLEMKKHTRRMSPLVTRLVLCFILLALSLNVVLPLRDFVSQNITRRQRMIATYGSLDLTTAKKNIFQAQQLLALRSLDQLPILEKQHTELFIDRQSPYWSLSNQCAGASFIAPALAGIALVDGLPLGQCHENEYALHIYQHTRYVDQPLSTLCQNIQKPFSTTYLFTDDVNQGIFMPLNCSVQ